MGSRKKIGIIYNYNENWIGGTYYIQNLISALNHVKGSDKPYLYVYTDKDEHFQQLKDVTRYPYIKRGRYFIKRNIVRRCLNKLARLSLNVELFSHFNKQADIVFPAIHEAMFHPLQKFVYWIPDFQEHYLPEFFSKEEIANRKEYQKSIAEKDSKIIFSSLAVQEDFNNIFPGAKVKQFVLPFAVTHHPFGNKEKTGPEKHNIRIPYFICCNQFWKHKNHIKVLEAIKILKTHNEKVYVVFTGKENDYRNPHFFKELTDAVASMDISDCVRFLGFIDRQDQLSLMTSSLAVIQPSFFEGWSTVIEDAKSLKTRIVASDIKVHREQLDVYPDRLFFNPYEAEDLAKKMLSVIKETASKPYYYEYNNSIKRFGNDFIKIINS